MRYALLISVALLTACREQRTQLGQALSGKPPVIAGSLSGEWQIADLNGGGPVAGGSLVFDGGGQGSSRVSGTAGCNRFTASWAQGGVTPQFGPFAATMMACAPAVMAVEQRVLALLKAASSVVFTEDGAAILATPDGRKLRLTQLVKD